MLPAPLCHPGLVDTPEAVTALCARLREPPPGGTSGAGVGMHSIAFDTEFIRESTFYPKVELIQVATRDESWIVDAAAFKKGHKPGPGGGFEAGLQPLLDVFQDPKILKVLHAAQGDQECLYTSFGIVAAPVLDTAVAAALCGMGEAVGLGRLFGDVLEIELKKGHARTNWSMRPLPEALLNYAHADVTHLIEVADRLMCKLAERQRRDWALEASAKSANPRLYDPDPAELAERLGRGRRLDRKGMAALHALMHWREERVKGLNLPRRWIADDSVLADLASVRPKDSGHLGTFRGLNKGEMRHSGDRILEILGQAENGALKAPARPAPAESASGPPSKRGGGGGGGAISLSTADQQMLDLFKVYLGILADRHQISVKHLATVPMLNQVFRGSIATVEDLVSFGVISGEAAKIVGEEVLAFLQGRLLLRLVPQKSGRWNVDLERHPG